MKHIKTFESKRPEPRDKNIDKSKVLKSKIRNSIQGKLVISNSQSIHLSVDEIYNLIKEKEDKLISKIETRLSELKEALPSDDLLNQSLSDDDYLSAGEIKGQIIALEDILNDITK